MRIFKYIFLLILLVSLVILVSCGDIDGQYMQIESTF